MQRGDGGAGEEVLEHAADGRDPFSRDLGADRQRDRHLLRERGGSGKPLHAGPVEIDHIHRGRGHARKAQCLSDDLVSELERRHLVQDVGNRHHPGSDLRELAGRAEIVLFVGLRIVPGLAADGVHQLLPGAEVAVDGSAAHPGGFGDLPHGRLAVGGEQPPRGIEDCGSVQRRVTALAPGRRMLSQPLGARLVVKWNTGTHLGAQVYPYGRCLSRSCAGRTNTRRKNGPLVRHLFDFVNNWS